MNQDPTVHGILVQLPLPPQINSRKVIEAIAPAKDVDGFHPLTAGLLSTGLPGIVPCTPLACILLAKHVHGSLAGHEAVVIGRSNIVGKPLAQLLLMENATVTIAHSKTRDLPAVCRRGALVFAAVGQPEMVRRDWVKPDATIIDVGINRVSAEDGKTKIVGDVAFAEVAEVAGAITPVPGGVGPMTIACLMLNTLKAACTQNGLPQPVIPAQPEITLAYRATNERASHTTGRRLRLTRLWKQRETTSSFWAQRQSTSFFTGKQSCLSTLGLRASILPRRAGAYWRCGTHE